MSDISRLAKETLAVVADLRRRGCRVQGARVLPSPAIRVDRPQRGVIETYAFRPRPRGTVPIPVECVAMINGVRVTWLEVQP